MRRGMTLLFRMRVRAVTLIVPGKFSVTWAEDLLCEADPAAVPRSAHWMPVTPSARPTGKRLERSAGLRALLKLLSRLQMGMHRPFDTPLWNRTVKSLAHVRRLVPELPSIRQADAASVAQVEALVNNLCGAGAYCCKTGLETGHQGLACSLQGLC